MFASELIERLRTLLEVSGKPDLMIVLEPDGDGVYESAEIELQNCVSSGDGWHSNTTECDEQVIKVF